MAGQLTGTFPALIPFFIGFDAASHLLPTTE
jgi:hypothetical protein